jgi:3-deoxy-D-manno-octulosonic-acid transferase
VWSNAQDVADGLLAAHGAIAVATASDLALQIQNLSANDSLRQELGKNAVAVVTQNRGAVARVMNAISVAIQKS